MEDKSSCCFDCRWQVTCDKHTQHTLRHSTIYPDSEFIDSCERYEPMFLSERQLAKICGTSKRVIEYAMSKGDDFAVKDIKERFGVEIEIRREPTDPTGRARIVLKRRNRNA